MKEQDRIKAEQELKAVMQDLKEDPYRKFKQAFALMSIIPFLVFFYLLVVKLFTINILIGNMGLVLFISIFISLCGFCVGYAIIKNILNRIIFYAVQAKHSDLLKSTFVAVVSHELKNPLSVIKLNLSNVLEGLLGQINEEQKKILKTCYSMAGRIHYLIGDLLDLNKIEAGKIEINKKLCNLVEMIEEQLKEFEITLNKKRLKLIKEIAQEDLSMWVDEEKITRVINNLLSNAVKYTPEEGTVTVKAYREDGSIRMEFIDTGSGIYPDELTNIFNKFERLNVTKEGTGLGLAIAKDIVEMHKGKIWVESKLDEGSKFVVVLPRDLREAQG